MSVLPNETSRAEGTIQFAYDLQPGQGFDGLGDALRLLLNWRATLRGMQLIGQTPARYGGLGYGNLSMRDPDQPRQFIVTASQTSGIENLAADGLCRIRDYDLNRFRVAAEGAKPPSSESLTHAMVYAADPATRWVFHAHSRELWQRAQQLELPTIAADIGYGTPAMAAAVAELLNAHGKRPLVFATLGHEDGIFACGATAESTGGALVGLN